jgi:hypothetical protein
MAPPSQELEPPANPERFKSGYSDAFERANELYLPIYELAKRASKVPLRTPKGTPVKAMATLVEMDCIDIIEAIPDASAWALFEIAQLGGFAAPPWMKREGAWHCCHKRTNYA